MRGATFQVVVVQASTVISIHAPHAGSDHVTDFCVRLSLISIHAPHAGSDFRDYAEGSTTKISIHAPHAGSDQIVQRYQAVQEKFQSTLPMRGATVLVHHYRLKLCISIHAPHAGSDQRLPIFSYY